MGKKTTTCTQIPGFQDHPRAPPRPPVGPSLARAIVQAVQRAKGHGERGGECGWGSHPALPTKLRAQRQVCLFLICTKAPLGLVMALLGTCNPPPPPQYCRPLSPSPGPSLAFYVLHLLFSSLFISESGLCQGVWKPVSRSSETPQEEVCHSLRTWCPVREGQGQGLGARHFVGLGPASGPKHVEMYTQLSSLPRLGCPCGVQGMDPPVTSFKLLAIYYIRNL